MGHLPVMDARALESVLLRLGFVRVCQKGSHVFYRHPDGRATTIPHHRGRDLAKPILHEILRNIEMPPRQFLHALEEPGAR